MTDELINDDHINKELLDAVIDDHFPMTKELLEKGADPNYFEDEAQIRPLHFAALYNSVAVVPLLITAGADIGATTEYHDTALQIARRHDHDGIVRIIQKLYGVNVDKDITRQ